MKKILISLFVFLILLVSSVMLVSANTVIDLSTESSSTIVGIDAGDSSGYSVSSGDFNGDGKEDVIIGAYQANPNGKSKAGETYVIFGDPSGTISLSNAALTITGIDADDFSGYSVSSGDINGDGKDDVILSAIYADPNGVSKAGEIYVVYGGTSGTLSLSSAALTINGIAADDASGLSVSSGDINGDGKDDVIIGANWADPNGKISAGKTYVVYGGTTGIVNLNTGADITINGVDAGDYSGVSVASGDINGDGKDDVIIGAYYADPGGKSSAGETYVVYGGVSGTINLNTGAAITINGGNAGDYSGRTVASGDINGDGKDDVLIGGMDSSVSPRITQTNVVYGGASGIVNLNTGADLTIKGVSDDAQSIISLSSGDVNDDGKDDVIIGAYYAGSTAGETYVVYGGVSGTVNLNTGADLTINGVDAGDYSGVSVASGDIDGDGKDDVIIGGSGANSGAGETYVVHGNLGGLSLECSPSLNQNWYITDVQTCDGTTVTTGTGKIYIQAGGKLEITNGATVTSNNWDCTHTSDCWSKDHSSTFNW